MRNVTAMALLSCAVLLIVARADDNGKNSPEKSDERPAKLMIYPARNAPVSELAETLAEVLVESGGRVVADPASNVLLIQTSDENHETVAALLRQLDRTPSLFRIQVHLLEARGDALAELDTASLTGATDEVLKSIKSLVSDGRLHVANRIEMTALENNSAFVQTGEDVALPSATTSGPGRGASTNYRSVSIGTMFKVQARLSGESDIVLEMDFEKSGINPMQVVTEESQLAPRNISRLTNQTTVSIQTGHSLLVGSVVGKSSEGDAETYLVLSASIETADAPKKIADAPKKIDVSKSPSPKPAANDPRYLAYYGKLLEKYDANNDKLLDAEERSTMSKDCSEADTDKDGFVSLEELVAWSLNR